MSDKTVSIIVLENCYASGKPLKKSNNPVSVSVADAKQLIAIGRAKSADKAKPSA